MTIRVILAIPFLALAVFVFFSEVLGFYKFRYVMNRMHAAAMGDTLGILLVLGGLMVFSGFTALSLKLLLTIVMLWLTSPVSSHLIGRLEVHINEKLDTHLKEVKH